MCLGYWTLIMEAQNSSKILSSVYESARCNVSEDVNRRQHCNANFKSYVIRLPVITKPVVMNDSV